MAFLPFGKLIDRSQGLAELAERLYEEKRAGVVADSRFHVGVEPVVDEQPALHFQCRAGLFRRGNTAIREIAIKLRKLRAMQCDRGIAATARNRCSP